MNLRERFLEDCRNITNPIYLVIVSQFPTGEVDITTYTEDILNKLIYYKLLYDDNFCLKTNIKIKIINYIMA